MKDNKASKMLNKSMTTGNSTNPKAGEFFGKILGSITQTHIFHLMTDSYAQHMALGSFYEEMTELADGLIETYQGTKGKVVNYPSNISITTKYDPVMYLINLRNYIDLNKEKVCMRSNFLNAIDTLFDLIDSTIYKLQQLK